MTIYKFNLRLRLVTFSCNRKQFNPLFTIGKSLHIYMLDVFYKAWYCEGLTVLDRKGRETGPKWRVTDQFT